VLAAGFEVRIAVRLALALWAAAGLGFVAAKVRTISVAAPIVEQKLGPIRVMGQVELIEIRDKGIRITLDHVQAARFGDEPPAKIRLTVRKQTSRIAPGSWVRVTAVLMPPPSPSAPGDYDFGRRAYFEQLGAVGYTYGEAKLVGQAAQPTWLDRLGIKLEQLRSVMTARIRSVIPGSDGAIAAALITGDRSGVDQADTQAYRDSGLTHVLSISGLHLALAGGIFFWLVRAVLALFPAIALTYPIKKWAAVAALAGAGFYLLISGSDPPAVRSYIMLAMMFAAVLVDRPAITMRSVALAATLILLFAPESLISPGFEMSFAAVTCLVAYGEWEMSRTRDEEGPASLVRKAWRYMFGIAVASIVAGFATAPFAIFHFDRSAQYGIVSNLLSMPIAGFVIMPAATAAMILMPFGLDRLPLMVMGKGVAMMSAVAHWTASLPGAASVLPAWPMSALLVMVFGGLWIALWRRRWRWLGLIPVALGAAIASTAHPPDLLIGRDGETVAVRLANAKLGFVRAPKDDFAAEAWLKRDGDRRLPEDAVATRHDGVRCDGLGCNVRLASGALVAVVGRDEALTEDCARARVVVSAIRLHGTCHGPQLVIDGSDTARSGAHAVWVGRTIRVVTVQSERGDRPWSQSPREPHE
jgi:competence protein ComEC